MASCGGAAATGASCKTAAGAAVATVALNNLLIGVNTKDMTEAQKLAYSNLIQTIITGAATGMNMDSAAGQLASKMEIENNAFGMKEGDWKDISYTVFKEGVSLVGIVYKPARFGTLILDVSEIGYDLLTQNDPKTLVSFAGAEIIGRALESKHPGFK